MAIFETILLLLAGATVLSSLARRFCIPYPTFLAAGGAILAIIPGTPRLDVAPELILSLFVAPVLLDAAYDSSLRDLRQNWGPILSMVLGAVAVTTLAVALVAHWLFPDLPWAAAIALGALLAPPDAVAALAVLAQLSPPSRIRVILEGESLLNDASALLIYKLAVGAVLVGGFRPVEVVPAFLAVAVGSVATGWVLARVAPRVLRLFEDAPSSVILQFVLTFGVWLLAEHLGLSAVVTMVAFGVTLAQRPSAFMPARLRIPTLAIWRSVTTVLNVLAFTLIGLQIRPILEPLDSAERTRYLAAALLLLLTCVVVRFAWVMLHHLAETLLERLRAPGAPCPRLQRGTAKGGVVMGWCGMRGIVTLAAALALPESFPHRDFLLVAAFVVVIGTLVLQGITLRPVLAWLRLPPDLSREEELRAARQAVLEAGLATLDENACSVASQHVRREYQQALHKLSLGHDPRATSDHQLRLAAIAASREAVDVLRRERVIGDEAYRRVEAELDWQEMGSTRAEDLG